MLPHLGRIEHENVVIPHQVRDIALGLPGQDCQHLRWTQTNSSQSAVDLSTHLDVSQQPARTLRPNILVLTLTITGYLCGACTIEPCWASVGCYKCALTAGQFTDRPCLRIDLHAIVHASSAYRPPWTWARLPKARPRHRERRNSHATSSHQLDQLGDQRNHRAAAKCRASNFQF